MKKRIISILLLVLFFFSLASCDGQIEEDNPNNIINPVNPDTDGDGTTTDPDSSTDPTSVTFTVALFRVSTNTTYIPNSTINVYWYNETETHTASIDRTTGIASVTGLDGEYRVRVDTTNFPRRTSYDPNIYTCSNDNPNVVIRIYNLSSPERGNGTDLYSNIYQLSEMGNYRATINSADRKVYYQFYPTNPGIYKLQAKLDIFENILDIDAYVYNGSSSFKDENNPTVITDGGATNTYTKNPSWQVEADDETLGSVYAFSFSAIYMDGATVTYPITFDFEVSYEAFYDVESIPASVMRPQETFELGDALIPDMTGTRTNMAVPTSQDRYQISDSNIFYNEDDKFYHVGSLTGPKLCAYITTPCPYLGESFLTIQDPGNKTLTVSNGTECYEAFLIGGKYHAEWYTPEIQRTNPAYREFVNGDGVVYVTKELKDFLQKLAKQQKYFADGNGYMEVQGLDSDEDSQWLFACCYYR